MIDFAAKPDLVAPGTGTVSLSDKNSRMYVEKAQFLVRSIITSLATNTLGVPVLSTTFQPCLTLSGTSMAAPVVSGTVALMLQANPQLTPNLEAILQYLAGLRGYDWLTQGAGFLNARGAVVLADYFRTGHPVWLPEDDGLGATLVLGQPSRQRRCTHPRRYCVGANVVWGELHTRWAERCVGRKLRPGRHVRERQRRLGQQRRVGHRRRR